MHVINGALSGLGDALMDSRLIITAFLSQLTTSNVLIGLIAPLRDTGWFLPQLFITGLVERAPVKLDVYRATTIARAITWGLLIAAVFTIRDPGLLLFAFSVCVLSLAIASGVAGLPFMTVTAKLIPPNQRSTLFGLRQSTGGLLGALAGGALAFVLGGGLGLTYPQNFGAAFAGAAISNLIANYLFGLMVEKPEPVAAAQPPMLKNLRRAWDVARNDKTYRTYLIARSAILTGAASLAFLTVYAKRQMHVPDTTLGTFVPLTLITSLVSNMLWGRLADRRGGKLTLMLGALVGILFCALAVALTSGSVSGASAMAVPVLAAAFVAGGICNSAITVAGSPLVMEIAPAENRSLYFGLTNTALGIMMLLTSLLGVIVDQLGFMALFIFAALAFAFSVFQFGRMKGNG